MQDFKTPDISIQKTNQKHALDSLLTAQVRHGIDLRIFSVCIPNSPFVNTFSLLAVKFSFDCCMC